MSRSDICKENHQCFVTDALSFSSDSYSFPPAVTATPFPLTWKSFWKRKLSKWIKKPKNLQTHTPNNSLLLPLLQKPPRTKIPNPATFFFLVKLHLKCSVKGQIYKFQEWEQIPHASFLLYSGDYVLLTREDSKMLSSKRPHQETLPAAMELWIEWLQSTSHNCGCKTQPRNKALLQQGSVTLLTCCISPRNRLLLKIKEFNSCKPTTYFRRQGMLPRENYGNVIPPQHFQKTSIRKYELS